MKAISCCKFSEADNSFIFNAPKNTQERAAITAATAARKTMPVGAAAWFPGALVAGGAAVVGRSLYSAA